MRSVLTLALLLSFSLVALAPAAPADAHGVTHFRFEAPEDHTGPLGVRMTFDYGEDNKCVFVSKVSGTNFNQPVKYVEESNQFMGGMYSVQTAQAHARHEDQQVDTRTLRSSNAAYSVTLTTTGPFSGVEKYALVAMDAGSWVGAATGYQAPMLIDLTCDKPFTVGEFAKGYEAIAFTADGMSGGNGASANQLFGSLTYVDGDSVSATFTHSEVRALGRLSSGTAHTEGEARLSTPSGPVSWNLGAPGKFVHEGGAGEYALELEYLGVGLYERFWGAMYALDPVESL